MNTSEQLRCTSSQWLKDKIWDNLGMTIELNSELNSIVTMLANKLWLYATEIAQSSSRPVDENSIESNILRKVTQQNEVLCWYRSLLGDLRAIVEQI